VIVSNEIIMSKTKSRYQMEIMPGYGQTTQIFVGTGTARPNGREASVDNCDSRSQFWYGAVDYAI